jgi:hypothetical protein
MTYQDFLNQKTHEGALHGFDPVWMPPQLFDFQVALVTWAVQRNLCSKPQKAPACYIPAL